MNIKKRLIVFGTGSAAQEIIKYIDNDKAEILCFADNNKEKAGDTFWGCKIIPPEQMCNYSYDYILIASSYWKEIRHQLVKYGIDKSKILSPLSYRYNAEKAKKYKSIYNMYGIMHYYYAIKKHEEEFNPKLLGLFTNPNFFSRKDLYNVMKQNSSYITGKCMDFGCGTKPYRKLFKVEDYVGVEIETEHKDNDIVYYDGQTIPFEDNLFDSIISSEVFEHVINIEDIVKELYRVLKKGGYMLVTVPFVYPRHCWPNDYRRYTSQGLKKLLTDAGFEVVKYNTSSNYIKCIYELKNNYIAENIYGKNKITSGIAKCLIAKNNLTGAVGAKLLPKSDKVYLDNVIVVRKV